MLHAYMDLSGTHNGSPVLSISGFIAEESAWLTFDQAWKAALENSRWPSRLSRFHTFECVHCEDEFLDGRWRFAERLALYGDLTRVICQSAIRPIGASVITECFTQIPPEDLDLLRREENCLGTPLDVMFHSIAQQLIACVRESSESETVGIIFDQDDKKKEEHFSELAQRYMATYFLGDAFAAYGFGDSRKFTPLQAADLLAFGTHHYAQMFESFRVQNLSLYSGTDFPIIPAFYNMLLRLAESPVTSPVGTLVSLPQLQELVRKVKNNEILPRKVLAEN